MGSDTALATGHGDQAMREGGATAPLTVRLGMADLRDCVHCGLCLASCPTYLTTGIEMSSPRGRITMVRALGEGQAGFSPEFVRHMDQCLGCLACQTACPSGVTYGHALEGTRETIEQEYGRSPLDRAVRALLLWLFPYPARLRPLLVLLSWYQRLGLGRLVRASRFLEALSPRLGRMEALLPPVPPRAEWQPLPEVTWAAGPVRGRAGLLTGCAQRYLLPGVNRASARVLAAAGYDVVAPREQGCCGALHLHAGEVGEARALAKALIATFEGAGVDLVVSNAAGCGAAMREYGHLLRDEPGWRLRAAAFSAKVRDISEVAAGHAWNGSLRAVPVSVTYHEACHLAHAQGIRLEPRALLRGIPALRLVELPESDVCCGSAGVYNLLQPSFAQRILQRKIENIRRTGADFVAAGNIGCLLQLRLGLREAGLAVRTVHPVELLDWALHGMPAEGREQRGENGGMEQLGDTPHEC